MFTESKSRNRPPVNPAALCRMEGFGFPEKKHPVENDIFSRQEAMTGHDQKVLETKTVAVIGCGGLGSWMALSLARMGLRRLILIDPDSYDRSNAPRQLMFGVDIGAAKAHALGQNVKSHMTNAGEILAFRGGIEDGLSITGTPDGLLVGVDNNAARLSASAYGLAHKIPAVFAMLSSDGLRAQIVFQSPDGPCLRCLLPDLDPERAAPCAAAAITSCLIAAGHAVHVLATYMMGVSPQIWRETSLDGTTERVSRPSRRLGCACHVLLP